jgi:hypothetical protein
VSVAVDEAGKQCFSTEIDTLRGLSGGVRDLGQIADGHDLVSTDGYSLGVRMVGHAGKDLRIEQDAFGVVGTLAP